MDRLGPGDPRRIGAYRLLGRLGAGGMGQVFLARSDRGRTVAVKLVRQELAAREEFRNRFRREVHAAQQVGGRWTAPVLDADTEAPVPWVATGYVAGPSLQTVVGHDHGPLPERSVRILAAGLASALKDIHAAGLVHRDLKPSNVLVTIDGPRVIDFGIARALESVADTSLTRTGVLIGSPGFMAPEQVQGGRITPACDVFCLGSVLAYAASGRQPFGVANGAPHVLMFRITRDDPDLQGIPESLTELIADCLRKDPATRPTLDQILARTGADDTLSNGRSRDPWLPGALVAQLGRHAVQLLDTEDTDDTADTGGAEGTPGAGAGSGSAGSAAGAGAGAGGGAAPVAADAADAGGTVPAGPGPHPAPTPGPLNGAPRPVPGPAPAAPPRTPAAPPRAPGHPPYPQGSPIPYPQGSAVPYPQAPPRPPYATQPTTTAGPPPALLPGPPPHATYASHGPQDRYAERPARAGRRSTVALIVAAVLVAVGAGGSVYALLGGDDTAAKHGSTPSASSTPSKSAGPADADGSGTGTPDASPSSSPAGDGVIPAAYLGTWDGSIDTAAGHSTRKLVIQQGGVGDTVLTLTADGPADGGGTYHCVFEAELSSAPSGDGPVRIGPSTVTTGEPASSCTPGAATTLTVLSDGRLQRTNDDTGDRLTYTKAD